MRLTEYKRRIAAMESRANPPAPPQFTLVWVESHEGRPTGRYWEQDGFNGELVEKWGYHERPVREGEIHFNDALMNV